MILSAPSYQSFRIKSSYCNHRPKPSTSQALQYNFMQIIYDKITDCLILITQRTEKDCREIRPFPTAPYHHSRINYCKSCRIWLES